jgi:type 2A phosphatase activator TIP41
MPTMFFPENELAIEMCSCAGDGIDDTQQRQQQLLSFRVCARDALERVDNKQLPPFTVQATDAWRASRKDCVQLMENEGVAPFDWTYTTDYRGTCAASPEQQQWTEVELATTEHEHVSLLNYNLLRRPDPILFFDEVVLCTSMLCSISIFFSSHRYLLKQIHLIL